MTDWQVKQIVDAIREHTRAMVAERLWAQAEAGTDVNHVVADADALLAALSASGGRENDAASRTGDVRDEGVVDHPDHGHQAATPPLSADAAGIDDVIAVHGFATVRRDDLTWALKIRKLRTVAEDDRLIALAERGARFTKEHEAVIEAALAFSHEEKCDNCCQDWPPGTKCAGCALESAKRALNERREKEGGR